MLLRRIAPLFGLFAAASAWNTDVHNQIGFMAEKLISHHTTSVLQEILEPMYNGSIGQAAAWADSFAHTPEGAFSFQWHWIDSSDNPPGVCNVFYNRDCTAGGCVVRAIANQTEILAGCVDQVKAGKLKGGTNITCSEALKWVVHFLGDVAQPLHASGIAVGGNDFDVTFGGAKTELHAVWDGKILYSLANVTRFSNTSISPFFTSLLSRIKADTLFVPVSSMLSCTDPSTSLGCALEWARESNAWTCDFVYSQIYNNTDLLTSGYARGAYPIVEVQVSRAAVRLGKWLDLVVAGHYKKDREVVLVENPSWVLGPDAGI
ncbi:nuclease PA3 [Punctularia strigosozonata HHB-11173 SS5]|uniref:nuclease PA3 n=1 Tax=Punctularia strigosozonata (strain HHB-11173) TaxID=741275 RepID=UPI0004418021|nr:nuclease PA3 [Punctularia strigosozonata HHB-11173 SS5]EIN11624.1 nuclease PA3 [Punctularia strigosozonata HHB-11173 SS5]